MEGNWTVNEQDLSMMKELEDFLPAKILDMHAHLWKTADLHQPEPNLCSEGGPVAAIEDWRGQMSRLFGASRLCGGLMIGFPAAGCDIGKVNGFICEQVQNEPDFRGSVLISPEYPRGKTLETLDRRGIAGIKPYHSLCRDFPTFQAPLSSFLPEWAWEAANERRLLITIHLVRDKALADPDNQRELVAMCSRYPGARVILAHAGRGFCGRNTVKGIPALKGLRNVWFDMSGICESTALMAVLRAFGPERLLWGSDFPVSHIRGKCVSVGDGFAWLQPDTVSWDKLSPQCHPTLICIESLRALREAADFMGLGERDIENIFYHNGAALLGLDRRA